MANCSEITSGFRMQSYEKFEETVLAPPVLHALQWFIRCITLLGKAIIVVFPLLG